MSEELRKAAQADLLPCPFCGHKPEVERWGSRRQSCIIECGYCGARLESSDEGEGNATSWNTRIAAPQAAPEPPSKPYGGDPAEPRDDSDRHAHALMAEVRAYLAQPPAKPMAWMSPGGDVSRSLKYFGDMGFSNCVPLYATPPDAAAEIAAMRAANLDCMDHFNVLKVDYDNQAAEIAKLEARLAEIMPLFVEARDALPAISVTSAKLHGVQLDLADRMDAVGTRDWRSATGYATPDEYRAGLAAKDQWIPCSERMPTAGEMVLTAYRRGTTMARLVGPHLTHGGLRPKSFLERRTNTELDGVTHWQPLPAAPQPKEGK